MCLQRGCRSQVGPLRVWVQDGYTPLMLAVEKFGGFRNKIVELLVKANADVNAADEQVRFPCMPLRHMAAFQGM
jgi:hypothetical protein